MTARLVELDAQILAKKRQKWREQEAKAEAQRLAEEQWTDSQERAPKMLGETGETSDRPRAEDLQETDGDQEMAVAPDDIIEHFNKQVAEFRQWLQTGMLPAIREYIDVLQNLFPIMHSLDRQLHEGRVEWGEANSIRVVEGFGMKIIYLGSDEDKATDAEEHAEEPQEDEEQGSCQSLQTEILSALSELRETLRLLSWFIEYLHWQIRGWRRDWAEVNFLRMVEGEGVSYPVLRDDNDTDVGNRAEAHARDLQKDQEGEE